MLTSEVHIMRSPMLRRRPATLHGHGLTLTLAAALVCQGVWPTSAWSQANDPKASDVKPGEIKKVELHRLSNDELLKHANAIHDKASWDYLAQARALAFGEA